MCYLFVGLLYNFDMKNIYIFVLLLLCACDTSSRKLSKAGMSDACIRGGNHTKAQCLCIANNFYNVLDDEEFARLSKNPTDTKEFHGKFESAINHCFKEDVGRWIVEDCVILGKNGKHDCECAADRFLRDMDDEALSNLRKNKNINNDKFRERFKQAKIDCALK